MKAEHRTRGVLRTTHLSLGLLLAVACGDSTSTDAGDAGFSPDGSRLDGGADSGFDDARTDGGTVECQLDTATSDVERYAAMLDCLNTPEREQHIARFVREVEASEGFPILDGGDAIFVYVRRAEFDVEDDKGDAEDFDRGRREGPIEVVLDFAGANPVRVAMIQDGDFFHVRTPVSPDGLGYKFVARDGGGAEWWFSDPLSRRFDFDPNGRYSYVRGPAAAGHIQWIRNVRATELDVDRRIYAYVPPGYDQNSQAYPVLYMHDGNNLFHPALPNSTPVTWYVHSVMDVELGQGTVRPGIIVGVPNNANRFGEYTHTTDDIGQGPIGGDGAAYANFIVNDLKPVIDERYRTLTDRTNTGVLGSSLGGLISFHIGQLHPTVFRFVGGMSSTFGWGQIGASNPRMIEIYDGLADLPARDQIFYLDNGGGPGTGCPDGGEDNYCTTAEMRDLLVQEGITGFPNDPNAWPIDPSVNIYHWTEAGAPHNEAAWADRLFRPLRMFFRP